MSEGESSEAPVPVQEVGEPYTEMVEGEIVADGASALPKKPAEEPPVEVVDVVDIRPGSNIFTAEFEARAELLGLAEERGRHLSKWVNTLEGREEAANTKALLEQVLGQETKRRLQGAVEGTGRTLSGRVRESYLGTIGEGLQSHATDRVEQLMSGSPLLDHERDDFYLLIEPSYQMGLQPSGRLREQLGRLRVTLAQIADSGIAASELAKPEGQRGRLPLGYLIENVDLRAAGVQIPELEQKFVYGWESLKQ